MLLQQFLGFDNWPGNRIIQYFCALATTDRLGILQKLCNIFPSFGASIAVFNAIAVELGAHSLKVGALKNTMGSNKAY
jgi:hypothetical protein